MNLLQFNQKATAFSPINLRYLANCSQFAYESSSEIISKLNSLKLNSRPPRYFSDDGDNSTNTQGFIAGDDKKIIIGFRGTEPGKLKDWITDAKITQEVWTLDNRIGEVHYGFYRALESVWETICEELIELRRDNSAKKIWLTGHSLGGALALLAGATLEMQGVDGDKIDISGIYTFGQPRLGDVPFRNAFNAKMKSRCFRVVNNNDVVSRIPPQIFGYTHVGTLKYFDADGDLRDSMSRWAMFWDKFEGRVENFWSMSLKPDGVKDHSMDDYVQICKNA